eukprot:6104961-Prymnesium_polylepis.1
MLASAARPLGRAAGAPADQRASGSSLAPRAQPATLASRASSAAAPSLQRLADRRNECSARRTLAHSEAARTLSR